MQRRYSTKVDGGCSIPRHAKKPPGEAIFVSFQPHLLAQALDNLLENACKYSDPGSPILVRVDREEMNSRGITPPMMS